jgi:hypothetical protein
MVLKFQAMVLNFEPMEAYLKKMVSSLEGMKPFVRTFFRNAFWNVKTHCRNALTHCRSAKKRYKVPEKKCMVLKKYYAI